MTEAHRTDASPNSSAPFIPSGRRRQQAVGLLHAEMRRLGSLIMRAGDANQGRTGGALRWTGRLSAAVTKPQRASPDRHQPGEIGGPAARGLGNVITPPVPLTSAPLADAIRETHRAKDALALFSMRSAPIVPARIPIDMSRRGFCPRYDKVGPGGYRRDYIKLPMNRSS